MYVLAVLGFSFIKRTTSSTFLGFNEISASDKNFVVKVHNDYRTDISNKKISSLPRGKNFKQITWDDELASSASLYARDCTWGHDSASLNVCKTDGCGENLGAQSCPWKGKWCKFDL